MVEKVFEVTYKESTYTIKRETRENDHKNVYYVLIIDNLLLHKHKVTLPNEKGLKREIIHTLKGYLHYLNDTFRKDTQDAIDLKEVIKSLKQ